MTCEGIEHLNYPLQHKLPANQHTTNIPTIHNNNKNLSELINLLSPWNKIFFKETKGQRQKIRPQLIQTKNIFQIHASLRILSSCNYLWVWKIPQHVKLLGKHPTTRSRCVVNWLQSSDLIKIQIVEASFILNISNNLDHGNFYQLKIFWQLVKKA
jgi:hypothetical protein